MNSLNTLITGTGSYIPSLVIKNRDFIGHDFYNKDNTAIDNPGESVVKKFLDITGIFERRWIDDNLTCSDIAAISATKAIEDAGIDPETIDHIIIAHNYGDIIKGTIQSDIVPCLAARVKQALKIKNPACIAYDIMFGCPGWIQGLIQADSFIKSGLAKRCLVIGAETLSRVVDKHDRDAMIFADGAGAAVVEVREESYKRGFLSSATQTDSIEEAYYIYMGKSNQPESDPKVRYIKMDGRKVYEYSLNKVPLAIKAALDKTEIPVEQVKKIIIHQANEKMDEAIIKRFYKLYGMNQNVSEVMPMNIHELGNSSVATVPTLYDMVLKNKLKNHTIQKDDIIIFASVGAGMNINALVYKV